MERQEAEREEHGKGGVRRPRSDAARRPRPPQSAAAPAPDVHAGSHVSYDSYREPPPLSDHPTAHERRPGDRFVDVRNLSGFFFFFWFELLSLAISLGTELLW